MSLVTEEIKGSASEVYNGDEICQEKSKSLLEEMGMPRGLLPLKDIEECGYVKDTGFVWLKQKKSITHKFEKIGKLVSYATEVTAVIEKNKIKKLSGVKSKELLIWVTLSEISVDDPPTGKITFKTPAGLSRAYPVSAFEIEVLSGCSCRDGGDYERYFLLFLLISVISPPNGKLFPNQESKARMVAESTFIPPCFQPPQIGVFKPKQRLCLQIPVCSRESNNMAYCLAKKGIAREECKDNLVDRISELPQELLVHVLSSLSFEEAVRSSVISRIWRDLWKFVTLSLNFDASKTLMSNQSKLKKHRDGYVEWITRVLNTHKTPTIDELTVRCDLNYWYTYDINRWIELALMKKVKRLELDFKPYMLKQRRAGEYYWFGPELCASSEIKFLTSICFKHVEVSDQVLESLLSNCPLLETLHVSHSPSVELTKLNVCGSSLRLKHLHISFCNFIRSIEVYAPNLVSFEYSGDRLWHLVLSYVPQLRDVSYGVPWDIIEDNFLQAFPACLTTCVSQLVNLSVQFKYRTEILPCPTLPNLRYLTCEVHEFEHEKERKGLLSLLSLVDFSPLLQKFKVELEIRIAHGLKRVRGEIEEAIKGVETMIKYEKRRNMESLSEVEIVGFVGAEADTALLIYLAKTAVNLDNIVINACPPYWNRAGVDMLWINEPGRARRLAFDMLLELRPEGANILVL
ncbi:hypothetical protein HRI_004843000 [Hibiscus trionum]|uniref:F-box domain-containing protein n=1 Tax=Hibiscus trionum TaxID=183268 RepID=A0A9W7MNJ6_HIBTR|nr:hypothetical protein HRI_004843000 [Hibiscus trionum]